MFGTLSSREVSGTGGREDGYSAPGEWVPVPGSEPASAERGGRSGHRGVGLGSEASRRSGTASGPPAAESPAPTGGSAWRLSWVLGPTRDNPAVATRPGDQVSGSPRGMFLLSTRCRMQKRPKGVEGAGKLPERAGLGRRLGGPGLPVAEAAGGQGPMCPVGALAGKCLVPILLGSLPTLTVTMVIMGPGTAAALEHLPRGKASGSSSLTGCASQPLRAGGGVVADAVRGS